VIESVQTGKTSGERMKNEARTNRPKRAKPHGRVSCLDFGAISHFYSISTKLLPLVSTPSYINMSTTATRKLNALVIGGTSGIGEGIALALAKRGYDVTIAGRSPKNVLPLLQEAGSSDGDHTFCSFDGFDLETIHNLPKSPDLLVLTHGMATTQGYTPTKDGLDQKLQLHYFSRIHAARIVAPKARILSVLSAGVHSRYDNFEKDFELKNSYSIKNAADAAGFYNDAGFEKLSEENPSLVVVHAAPGFVNTNWGTEMPWYIRGAVRALQPLGRSKEKCGEVLTNAWLELPSGFHLMDANGNPVVTKKPLYTKEERDVIWAKTLELLPDL
jgi:NAD(P)-dependent dehydrogenase (short-subunit alcohol dehydrogenase family)